MDATQRPQRPSSAPLPDALALSVPAAAKLAGIGSAKLWELIAEGQGPPTLAIGRRRLIRREALDRWLRDLEGGR